MKNYLLVASVILLFTACHKESISVSPNQLISCVPVATDPTILGATDVNKKNGAIQFVYPAITLQKNMSGLLANLTSDSLKGYQFHVYIYTAGRYYLLPSSTTGNNKYSYSIESSGKISTFNIVRTTGVSENFDAIKVVAVSMNYLQQEQFAIDYSNFSTIQALFDLP